ncbi:MAG TPA: dienelactone hydrolase family protein [Chloroflexota bacterium]|nr:dienelactone hydrolase family protein [Chloroflexota bacterium]
MADEKRITVDGLRALVVKPDSPSKGGVLVLPTIQGIEHHMQTVCGWITDAGLTALVWDPFSAYDREMPPEKRYPIGRDQLEDRPALQEQIHWVDYMHQELGLESVGTIGFCLGGRMVFTLCAAEPRLKACVAYHPSIDYPSPSRHLDAVAAAKDVTCPVQILYPGQDRITKRETFQALRESLEKSAAPTIVQLFPHADHGFTERGVSIVSGVDRGSNPANIEATKLGWPQTVALFRACLL